MLPAAPKKEPSGCWICHNEKRESKRIDTKQIFCAFVINLVSFLQGASLPVSCVLITQLKAAENDTVDLDSFNLTRKMDDDLVMVEEPIETSFIPSKDFELSDNEGWVASSWVLGHLFSSIFAGFLNDKIGRKKSLIIDTVVFALTDKRGEGFIFFLYLEKSCFQSY